MLRLVQADGSTTGKLDRRDRSPSSFLYAGASDALLQESGHFATEVIAHQIELVSTIVTGGMNGQLRWRKPEDQPIVASVRRRVSEDIPEEHSVCRGIRSVQNHVSGSDFSSAQEGFPTCLPQGVNQSQRHTDPAIKGKALLRSETRDAGCQPVFVLELAAVDRVDWNDTGTSLSTQFHFDGIQWVAVPSSCPPAKHASHAFGDVGSAASSEAPPGLTE
jgi:hypothetical protein